ncbi:MAG TPA: outer membrane beta-barrel protein [Telluria sp.]|nr:outer membrane beta-barrel protein [Telluria sp.]
MKKLVIAALALSCSTAFADNMYVGVGIGSATQKVSEEGFDLSKSSTAASINAGYQFTPVFGAEVGYVHFGEATASASGMTVGAKPKSFYLAGTATYAVTPEFGVFAKVGAARTKTDVFFDDGIARQEDSDSRTTAMFGIGASYAFTPAISATLEYQNFGKVIDQGGATLKASHVSAGLRFSF